MDGTEYDDLVRRLREDRRSTEDIAKQAKVPLGTVKKIIHGHTSNPRIRTVEKLWKLYPEPTAEARQ